MDNVAAFRIVAAFPYVLHHTLEIPHTVLRFGTICASVSIVSSNGVSDPYGDDRRHRHRPSPILFFRLDPDLLLDIFYFPSFHKDHPTYQNRLFVLYHHLIAINPRSLFRFSQNYPALPGSLTIVIGCSSVDPVIKCCKAHCFHIIIITILIQSYAKVPIETFW